MLLSSCATKLCRGHTFYPSHLLSRIPYQNSIFILLHTQWVAKYPKYANLRIQNGWKSSLSAVRSALFMRTSTMPSTWSEVTLICFMHAYMWFRVCLADKPSSCSGQNIYTYHVWLHNKSLRPSNLIPVIGWFK